MSAFFAFFAFLVVYHATQSQETADFYVYHSFKALDSSPIIKVLKVQGQLNCAFSCSRLPNCRSFNFAHKKDLNGKHLCQLLPNEKQESKTLKRSDVFHYYEKSNPDPCNSHPCQNGGKCDVIAGLRNFTCTCTPKFKGRFCELDNWTKINPNPICFGARDSTCGTFSVQRTGVCIQIKLVYRSGYVTCDTSDPKGKGYWGCVINGRHEFLSVVITDINNIVLLPGSGSFTLPGTHVYNLHGMTATSKELVYPELPGLFPVTSGKVYRIWFGQDLDDFSESDNGGSVCSDVYCIYQ